jgi:replicative DNA helicase
MDDSHLRQIAAEQALLGALFIKPSLAGELPGLQSEHFSEPLHQRIYGVMLRLASEGRALTPVTMAPFFANEEKVGEFTVAQYFGRLAAAAVTVHGAGAYSRIVQEFAVRRQLFHLAGKAQQVAGDMERTPAQAAADIAGLIDGVVTSAQLTRNTLSSAEEAAGQLLDELEFGQGEKPVPTGFADLDHEIGGLIRGEYHILGGRPSMGKTALGGGIVKNAAMAGAGTMFFSMEMKTRAVVARMISDMVYNADTPIPYSRILKHRADPSRGWLNGHEIYRLRDAHSKFKQMPLAIDDQSSLSVAEIGARIRRQAAKFEERGVELVLVVIDHKDFIRAATRYSGNKVAETAEISAGLKSLFKELNVAGLLLCQLTRETDKKDNKRPELSDLLWSGALEADADLVSFVYRQVYYLEHKRFDEDQEEENRLKTVEVCKNDLELILAKHRNGERKIIDLFASMPSNAIRDKSHRY